jgi:PAS domain S-box-containing protein
MIAATPFPRIPESAELERRLLFQHSPLGIAHCSQKGDIIAMNPALERILGGTLATLPATLFGDIAQTSNHGESHRLFQQMIDGERQSLRIDNHVPGADGSGTWIRWTAWRVPGSGGRPDSSLVVAEDATDSRRSEQRLQQAERLEAIGRLASGVAHDFNNLVTGVLLYCDLLLLGLEPNHRFCKYVEEIRAAGLQASGLVRQLLAVARPQNIVPQPLCLNEVVEGMRTLLLRLIGENIQLQFQLEPNLGWVRMDPTQAQQVLLNLVLNARDALSDGGRIAIETGNCQMRLLGHNPAAHGPAELPCLLLLVSDNGKGMDAQTRLHLFDAFFTTKAPGRGTGLGLTTVHEIVTKSGGLIHVESEPGAGTRITVLLPMIPNTGVSNCLPNDI